MQAKIWQLDQSYYCSIIGTCLSLSELRRLARQMGIPASIWQDDDALHHESIERIQSCRRYARQLHKRLNQKFATRIKDWRSLKNKADLERAWQIISQQEQSHLYYWAAISHAQADEEFRRSIRAQLHLESHQAVQRRSDLQEQIKTLHQKAQRYQSDLQQEQQKKQGLLAQYHQLQAEYRQLKQRLSNQQQTEQKPLERYAIKLNFARCRIDRLQAEREQWRQQAEHYEQQNQALRAELEQLKAEMNGQQDCSSCQQRSACDLYQQTILFVGGRQRQIPHFKRLVEQCNGRFIHHDGGLEQNSQQLHDLLQQADRVFCPLDQISHQAMISIKKICRQQHKPLIFLAQSSLSSLQQSLLQS